MKPILFAAALASTLLLWPLTAGARLAPGQEPGPYHEWFGAQKIPAGDPQAGMSCCDTADGHIIEEDDWRIADGHYEIIIGSTWYPVPDSRVLPYSANPTGKPVAWYLVEPDAPHIFCFAPGTTS